MEQFQAVRAQSAGVGFYDVAATCPQIVCRGPQLWRCHTGLCRIRHWLISCCPVWATLLFGRSLSCDAEKCHWCVILQQFFSSLVTFAFDHKSLCDTFRSEDLVCWFHFCSCSYRAFHPLSTAPAVQEASIYRHSSDASTVCDWLTWLFIQWNPTQSYQRSLLNKRYANVCLRMKKKKKVSASSSMQKTLFRLTLGIHAGSLASVPQYIDWTGLLWHPIVVCVWLQTELLSRARSL